MQLQTYLYTLLIWIGLVSIGQGQCNIYTDQGLSTKTTSYKMQVVLDNLHKAADATQKILWTNTSPDTISELRFYMYMNAFSNSEAAFIKKGHGSVFNQFVLERDSVDWGFIRFNSFLDENGRSLLPNGHYIQPTFNTFPRDKSVYSIRLKDPVYPGQTVSYNATFTVKMPEIMARSGYSIGDYYLFVHWFPQLGVYEQSETGEWGWNCHQFVPGTEFYSDFGDYEVTLDLPANMQVGATGCLVKGEYLGDRTVYTYQAYDVIDFAWVVYPAFEVYEEDFMDIDIKLMIPPEHKAHKERILTAAKNALTYLDQHVGPYPYPSLTIVDPPLHALRSGLMEYPMLITCGSVYGFPTFIRSLESLVIHELTHMYFMATLANNEKEEAWVDEGFVTYYEDRIIDHFYGEQSGFFDILGYRSGNREHSRLEYTSMSIPNIGTIGRPGWEFEMSSYKPLIYSKTATTLQTLQRWVGDDEMDRLIQSYFQKYKFQHPRGRDFINHAVAYVGDNSFLFSKKEAAALLEQAIYTDKICDYSVGKIFHHQQYEPAGLFMRSDQQVDYQPYSGTSGTQAEVTLYRLGEMVMPQEIRITLKDGREIWRYWDGKSRKHTIRMAANHHVIAVEVDPHQKNYLDIDFNNNSKSLIKQHKPTLKYASKATQWVQNYLQATTLFF